MSPDLGSDSNFDFQLVPIDDATAARQVGAVSDSSMARIDVESDGPLPWTPASPATAAGDGEPTGMRDEQSERIESPEGRIWLEGDVLMCGCPDCLAPMTIRLWLMIADCWRCGTSIELTEQQEREAQRLLQRRQAATRSEPVTRRPAPRAAAVGIPAADGGTAALGSPDPTTDPEPPPLRPPQPPRQAVARSRVAASDNLGRRRTRRKVRPGGWFAALFRSMPAWLVSLLFHLILLTLLALLTIPSDDDARTIVLNAVVSKDVRRPGQPVIETPAERLQYDPLVPKELDLQNPATRETVLRADQDARELRLVDQANPYLPDLAHIKEQIASAQGHRVAVAARDPRVRTEVLLQEGGTTLTEAAVARGLRWLAQQQQPDGRWRLDGGKRSDAAATGLALLPFLGAGQTQQSGRYQDVVAKGLRWLLEQQRQDGDLRGGGSDNTGMYAHGQCAIVLCEAYLMTGDESLRVAAQKAVDFIVAAQYPDGGWRYKPLAETNKYERRSDTSVVGWQLMALQSARAANLEVPLETFELSSHFLDSVQSHDGSRYAYQPQNSPTHVMTAEALLCRIYQGWKGDNPALLEGVDYLLDQYLPNRRDSNMYFWYYATQTFHHIGGAPWDRWNFHMRDVLVSSQETSGRHAGSWSPKYHHDVAGGRVYMTALAVCTLEVYYRHLPIFRQIDVD